MSLAWLHRDVHPAREAGSVASRLGRISRPDEVLDELHRLLVAQESIPLPPGWDAEVVVHTWGRSPLEQDLVVSSASPGREIADVLTVRPAAEEAGESELLLLGAALTGLVGSVPPDWLLPAVATYLRRMSWTEPVPAAALTVDTAGGEYVVRACGTYLVAQLLGGSGRWHPLAPSTSPPLEYGRAELHEWRGTLDRRDALVVFGPPVSDYDDRSPASRLDGMLGQIESVLTQSRGEESGRLAARLAEGESPGTVLLLRRR